MTEPQDRPKSPARGGEGAGSPGASVTGRGLPSDGVRCIGTEPEGLGTSGSALWESITAEFDLDPREVHLLQLAARQADHLADLEEILRTDGLSVSGSAGQPRLHPAVAEARQARVALARLVGQLALPQEGGKPTTARGQQARDAAKVRWSKRVGNG